MKITPWYEVYDLVAMELNAFYKKYGDKSGKLLYKKLSVQSVFKREKWFTNFKVEYKTGSMDPIHIFSSFSGYGSLEDNRLIRIKILLSVLNEKYKNNFLFDNVDFTGCPSPIAIRLYKPRPVAIQKKIWSIFSGVYEKKKHGLPIDIFEQIETWYGISPGLFTIFLFWIRPRTFIPLDSKTIELLREAGRLKSRPNDLTSYLNLLEPRDSKLFINISTIAFDRKKLDKLSNQERKKVEQYLSSTDSYKKLSVAKGGREPIKGFKLLAIRPLSGCNKVLKKTLKEGELYQFYSNFHIAANSIKVDYENSYNPYSFVDNRIEVNINAIVGRNGAGKSSLLELLYAALNNLAYYKYKKINNIHAELKLADSLCVEFYYMSGGIYKVRISHSKITVKYYTFDGNDEYKKVSGNIALDNFDLDELFYTIGMNYSLHSLNTNYFGAWLNQVFHKNDAYQTPLVLEPFRKEGNVDVNILNYLVKNRFLSNILEQEDEKFSLRYVSDKLKVESVEYSPNIEKVKLINHNGLSKKLADIVSEPEKLIKKTLTAFGFSLDDCRVTFDVNNESLYDDLAKLYILKKLTSIALKYPHYNYAIDGSSFKLDSIAINRYLDELSADTGHITFKLRQAINYLRYNVFKLSKNGKQSISIDKMVVCLENLKKDNRKIKDISTIEYLIPPFFDLTLKLSHDIDYDSLSSGEKQVIYSIHTILYHIRNIDSVAGGHSQLKKYSHLSIILDEIELYFHPEMQRGFLNKLIQAIKKMPIYELTAINISFITHSPFVISDIPKNNILFLRREDSPPHLTHSENIDVNPYGANIHDLLIDGFFMKSPMGDFVNLEISFVLDLYKDSKEAFRIKDKEQIEKCRKRYFENKERVTFTISNVSEPYLSKILARYNDAFYHWFEFQGEKLSKLQRLRAEVERLEREVTDNASS